MAAHGCINAAGQVHFAGTHHLFIKRLPHAVQSLEFIARIFTCHDFYGGNRLRVMRGKLRIERVAVGQHEFGTSQIAHIG